MWREICKKVSNETNVLENQCGFMLEDNNGSYIQS